MNFIKKNWLLFLLIGAGFFVYAFNLNNGLFWDDENWIINNPAVHGLSWSNIKFWFQNNTLAGIGLTSNYWRPFLFFTFAINYTISGLEPLGYHLVSNAVHIASAVLVFLLFNLALKKKWLSFLTAAFFLFHPLQTEAVTYISGRGDPLSVFFMLLGLYFFVLAEKNGVPWLGWRRIVSLLSLILALLSREVAIIFPFLAMVFYISFLSNDKFLGAFKKAIIKTIPHFTIVLIYGILRLTVLNFDNTLNFYSTPNIYSENLFVRLFTFAKVLVTYFKLLLFPTGLHMDRDMVPILNFFQWPVWLVALILVGLIFLLFRLYKKKSGDFPVWFFGFFWFFIALAPVSGITPINAILYEHWLYLPMIGFFFVFSFYLEKILYFLRTRKAVYFCLLAAVVGYFVFFSTQSIKRNIIWGKPIEFYLDILKYEPDSVRINNNLGNEYFNRGNQTESEKYYRKAISVEDIFPQPHFNLGGILESRGDTYGAIQEYKKSIEINPNFFYGYQNLVSIYGKQGDLANAWSYMEKLLELRPNDPRIQYNAGLIKWAVGDRKVAKSYLDRGLAIVGEDSETKKLIEDLLLKIK